ncbi:uncharacterized protein LOC130076370 [Rhinichthys klamathensis goyatoka]|uniref:uncharacterized protein LOC130076370 n=1 Tax=Rhinichthys klamathensis goyatoka TaxID=3034132 RepID=UPI0024B627E1|nr:uncharacterized protein LOC130076370 [Rhinichthys klamathensis goyatoka]
MTTHGNENTTTIMECICGKICKNRHGLRIHQAKMKCMQKEVESQRTGTTPGETQEEPGPESPHSARSLQVTQPPDAHRTSKHRRVKWPQASKEKEWRQFDGDADTILEATAKGRADRRLKTMTTIIISLAAERFGLEEKRAAKPPYTMNNRASKIHQLRQELKNLRQQFKAASEEERGPIAELRSIIRKKLITLRRAEWHRRRRKERSRRRAAFLVNPFGFTKQLLGQKRSGQLTCSKAEVDHHLKQSYSDEYREQDLGPCRFLINPPAPAMDFDGKEPGWKEIQEVVRRARANSAPGPSGVPYKVYKNCPRLLHRLWKILKVIWRKGKVVDQWRQAEGVWIPKEEKSQKIEQFRTISLLSVEGKIFFSLISRRLTDYLLKNSYIDTAVQKGGIPEVSGCLEHTGVVTQLIREARENKGDLAVLWLDLANAYGSIPHKLVEEALNRHHTPKKFRDLILDYYTNFHVRVSSGTTTSDWHKLEKGIITGCTISVILFALAMNMLVKSAEHCRGPLSKSGVRQPPIRAFMDDLTVTTTSVPGCRWILNGLQELMSWARMNFKPAKSRSLVLMKGKVTDKFHFSLGTTKIPSLTEEPVKSLGKVFNCSLRDAASIKATNQDLETWLAAVDKSGLPGKFKAWIYQHGILPRILWPLLVYEVPISTVESFEMRISRFLRRWLGLPRSLSSIALYGQNNKLKLPMSSLSEEFMVTRSREVLQYRDSSDPKVAQAGIEVRTGRKWRAAVAVDDAESRLRQRVLVGSVAHGRAGLGSRRTPRYDKAEGKERRSLILEEVRAGVEEKRACQMAGMRQQGAWTRWERTVERKVTWTELWKAEPYRIKFLIQAVYDVLPSPSNLFSWGKVETPACPLCQRRGTLEHILSCCPKALGEGRYRWRHDQVLKAVADSICSGISHSKSLRPAKTTAFVRAGEKLTPAARGTSSGLLATARDWELAVDLGKQLKFPEAVAITTLRPDIVLTSEASKQVILLELTVPWEDRMEEANERKRAKYSQLVEGCRSNGWRAICQPFEVGCRGFVGHSLCRAYKMLGITGASQRRAIKLATDAAEVASRWLWIKRGEAWHVG